VRAVHRGERCGPRLQLTKDALVNDPILAQDAGIAIHVSDVIDEAIIAI
jgi:hypothetical protein